MYTPVAEIIRFTCAALETVPSENICTSKLALRAVVDELVKLDPLSTVVRLFLMRILQESKSSYRQWRV